MVEEDRREILAAAFAPGALVAEVARQHDVATSLIYKWRLRTLSVNSGGPSFTSAVVVDEPASSGGRAASERGRRSWPAKAGHPRLYLPW